jgi:hypothetical protein
VWSNEVHVRKRERCKKTVYTHEALRHDSKSEVAPVFDLRTEVGSSLREKHKYQTGRLSRYRLYLPEGLQGVS